MEDKIYKYSKLIRNCNETVRDFFSKIVEIDEEGKAHVIPIIWATPTKLESILETSPGLASGNSPLLVDRIRLPLLTCSDFHIEPVSERIVQTEQGDMCPIRIYYNLWANSFFREGIDQVIEQVFLKFSPYAYIKMTPDSEWFYKLSLISTSNNFDDNKNTAIKVCKFGFGIISETHVRKDDHAS